MPAAPAFARAWTWMAPLLALAVAAATVLPAAEGPALDPVPAQVLAEDGAPLVVVLDGIRPGASGAQVVAVAATVADAALLLPPLVSYQAGQAAAQLLLAPLPDANGSTTVSATLTDDLGAATVVAVPVRIDAVNDPPRMSAPAALDLVEDQGDAVLAITALAPGPADESGQSLRLLAAAVDPALVQVVSATLVPGQDHAQIVLRPLANASGSTDLLVTVLDDGVPPRQTSAMVRVTVAAVNDPPVVLLSTPVRQIPVLGSESLGEWCLTLSDAEGDALEVILVQPPASGDIVSSADGHVLARGERMPYQAFARWQYFYRNTVATGSMDGFVLGYDDGHAPGDQGWGQRSVLLYFGGGAVPMLAASGTPPAWREGDPPVRLVETAVVEDVDSANFPGGNLSASIVAGARADDLLAVAITGNGQGNIEVVDGVVLFGGVAVGTVAGGRGAEPLRISFNAAATPAAAAALVEALRFSHLGRDPGDTARRVRITIDDGSTGASAGIEVVVQVAPVDDPPVATTAAVALAAGVARTVTATAADPDSPVLTWRLGAVPAGIQAELLDAAGGRLRLAAPAGSHGRYRLPLTVSDGTTTAAADLDLMVTAAGDPRPHPAADLPAQVWRGDRLQVDIPFDCSEVPGAELDVVAAGEVPSGLELVPLGPRSVRLVWQVAADEPLGHRSFALVAVVRGSLVSGVLPLLVLVRPPPQGGG